VGVDPDDIRVVWDVANGAGAGVVADREFSDGDLIVNYNGIHMAVADDQLPHENTFEFLYMLNNEPRQVDATEPASGIGRYINDVDPYHKANSVAKRVQLKSESSCITIRAMGTIKKGKCL
jgi:hypothetical protein